MKKKLLIIPLLFLIAIVFGTDLNAQTYCEPSATNTSRYINDFSTIGGVLNINNTGTGFSANGYGDFTNMTAEQEMGEDIDFEVYYASPSTYGFKIWIDWDQSETFEASEVAYQSSSYSVSHTGTFSVPVTALTGSTRMRIGNSYIPSSGPADPCVINFTYGEFEDYTFNVLPLPTCPKPTDIASASITTTSVDIDWTESASAAIWNVEIGTVGFAPGTGNETTADNGNTAQSSSFTGLTPITTYDVYVQADCGGGDMSYWEGPFKVTTLCVSVIAPWSENFENAGTIPDCWDQSASNLKDWEFANSGGFEHIGSDGTLNGNTNSDGYFAWLDDSSPHEIGTSLLSPMIDASGLTDPMLNFYLISDNEGNSNVDFSVDVWDGAAWNTGVYTSSSNTVGGAWEEIDVSFSSLTITGDIQLRFVVDENNGTDFYDDIAIDDISIYQTPSCESPYGLVASNVGKFNATVSWVDTVSSPNFIVEYGPAGFAPGNGTTVTVTDTFAVLSNLTSDQDYDYYVSGECFDGTDSLTEQGSFTTLLACAVPTDFSVVDVTATSVELTWNTAIGGATTFTVEYGPVGFTQGTGTTITAPPATINGLTPETDYDFYVIGECGGTDGPSQPAGPLNVTTPPTCPAPTFLSISDIGLDSAIVSWTENGVATDWVIEYDTVGFTLGTGTNMPTTDNPDTLMGLNPNYSYDIYVWANCGTNDLSDTLGPVDFSTDPTCPAPDSLSVVNLSQSSADLGWTETGAAADWQVEYGTAGFTPGAGTQEITSSNPHTISITDSSVFDFYVRSICGPGDTSVWVGPYSFSNYYCEPTNTYSTSYYIDDVITNGALGNLNNTGTGFSSNGYADYSATDTLVVYAGQSIDVTFVHPSSTNGYSLWVDWNKDYDFDDANENIFSSGYQGTPFNFTLTIPAIAQEDTLRMRVRNAYLGNPAPACGDFNYGEAEDYTLVIAPAPSCLQPENISLVSLDNNGATINWDGTASDYIVEWGIETFAPGTGTSVVVNDTFTTLTNLPVGATVDVYVRSICAPGDTSVYAGPLSFLTNCDAVEALGFCESFDTNSSSLGCWRVRNDNGDADAWAVSTFQPNNGDRSAILDTDFNSGDNDDYLITQPLILSGVESMNFAYSVRSSSEPNDFEVLLSTTNDETASFTDTLMDLASYSNETYKDTTIDLTSFGNDTVYIAFHVPPGGLDGYELYIDDVCFGLCNPTPGQEGSTDVCSLDGTLNLNDNIINKGYEGGYWSYPNDESSIIDDSLLNIASIPTGVNEVLWVAEGLCTKDTTVASINVYGPSSAGGDGTVEVCKNEPVNLFAALSGNVDLGGDWYDPSNQLLPNSQPTASNNPGQYNYDYIVANPVCPADTSLVEVTVKSDCDYTGLGEELFTDLSVYPNPASSEINIVNPANAASLTVEMLDMNGRLVLKNTQALNNATEATIAIDRLEKGVYTLRVYNESGQKTFKIVKQ